MEEESKRKFTRVFVFIVLVSGYILTRERLGYFVVTPIYIIATYLYLRATKFYKMILIAVGFTLFVYLLFVLFLHLPVPMGLLAEGELWNIF
jgi:cell division protein FtsW (lipid II flippase)